MNINEVGLSDEASYAGMSAFNGVGQGLRTICINTLRTSYDDGPLAGNTRSSNKRVDVVFDVCK